MIQNAPNNFIAPSALSLPGVEEYIKGGTIQQRHLKGVTDPLRLLVVSTRHGIGGAITDNAHIIPIREALGKVSDAQVIGASALGYENLGIKFHKDCFEARGERTPLDPLRSINSEKVRSIVRDLKPHVVLFLDAPEERPLMGENLLHPKHLLSMGAQCIVASHEAKPLSGFWAIRSVEIISSQKTERVDLYPNVPDSSFLHTANVYLESDRIARLFGSRGTPTQLVSEGDKKLADQALLALGITREDKVIYIHAGTSTALKELTPAQSSELIRRSRRELVRAGVELKDVTFVVSPEPVARPETSATILRCIEKLGGRGVLAPAGSFGLFRGIIGRADAVLCADTAAGHLANALNVPCAALYSNPDPAIPESLWGTGPVKQQIPNTLIARIHSNSALAQERFSGLAGHTEAQMSDAEFVVGVIVAAAVEGWGASLRKSGAGR